MIMNMATYGGVKQEFGFTYTGDYTDRLITYNSETYRLLTFTSSGIFTPNQSFVGDIWMCGGGGNGADASQDNYSGGGGAGGFATSANGLSFSPQGHNVAVGNAGELTSAFGYSADPGSSATNGEGASGGSGGGGGTVHHNVSGWGDDVDAESGGSGDGVSKIPFGDSENFQPHCAGGGGGARIISMEVSGGNGGSNGANGSKGAQQSENGGSGGSYGGGNGGGNNSGQAEDGNDATYYGGGGGGGSEGGNLSWPGNGGSGYQGVVYVRIKQ